jgi:hypothetical protein
MRRVLAAAVILPAILLNLSCGNSDDNLSLSTPGKPNVIFPLQVGNTWLYRRTTYDMQGSAIVVDTVLQRVGRDTLIQGERWYVWETTTGLSMATARSDGYWTYIGGVPALTFRYPPSVNDSYMLSDIGPMMRIRAVDTLIAVPYGTIPCIAYEQLSIPDQQRSRIDYCAANTGLVRTDEYVHTPSGVDSLDRRSDLIEFHLY